MISASKSFDRVLMNTTINTARTTSPTTVTVPTQGMVVLLRTLVPLRKKCTPIHGGCHHLQWTSHGPFAGEAKNARRALFRRSRHQVRRGHALRRPDRHARPHALGAPERRSLRGGDFRTGRASRGE